MKVNRKLLAYIFLASISSTASSSLITWDILTDYNDLTGTITFDDAPIAGLNDGDYDSGDTHINGANLSLTSSLLGIDYTNTNIVFQPLTNTFDNKHIDYTISVDSNIGLLSLYFSPNSDQGSPALGTSDYWLYVNNDSSYRWAFSDDVGVNNDSSLSPVSVPTTLSLLGACLAAFGFTRKKA